METKSTYKVTLKPWAVVRWMSLTERTVVARFKSRNDADGYMVVMRRLVPNGDFRVVFMQDDMEP